MGGLDSLARSVGILGRVEKAGARGLLPIKNLLYEPSKPTAGHKCRCGAHSSITLASKGLVVHDRTISYVGGRKSWKVVAMRLRTVANGGKNRSIYSENDMNNDKQYEYVTTWGRLQKCYAWGSASDEVDVEPPDNPVVPKGDGWEMCGATASSRLLYWFWKRPKPTRKKATT